MAGCSCWFGLEWWQRKKGERGHILKLILVPSTAWSHVFFHPYDQVFSSMWGIRRTNEIWEKCRHKEWGFKNKTIWRPFLSVWNYLNVRKLENPKTFTIKRQGEMCRLQVVEDLLFLTRQTGLWLWGGCLDVRLKIGLEGEKYLDNPRKVKPTEFNIL